MHSILLAFALASTPPAAAACAPPEHRQFDFWLGDWIVRGGADGQQVLGRNRFAREAGGCALHASTGAVPVDPPA
jgi:hypothetical protein